MSSKQSVYDQREAKRQTRLDADFRRKQQKRVQRAIQRQAQRLQVVPPKS